MAVMKLPSLTGQKQALFQFSQYLESQIKDPAVKQRLILRSHEAMAGAIAQGDLATDRAEAFMAERRTKHPDASRWKACQTKPGYRLSDPCFGDRSAERPTPAEFSNAPFRRH
jgi:hypothetical protein